MTPHNMTTRERLNQNGRRGLLLTILGFVTLGFGIAVGQVRESFSLISFLALLFLFTLALLTVMLMGRCIRCHRIVGKMFYTTGGLPFCVASDL
jgi:hypothetical protein